MPYQGSRAWEMELVKQILKGERERFCDLIKPYHRAVYAAVFAIVSNHADAEELSQEAFLKAFKELARFRFESRFSTWLIQISVNEARMRLRRAQGPVRLAGDMVSGHSGDEKPPEADIPDFRWVPDRVLESKLLGRKLSRAIGNLPSIYRDVFVLRDVEQWDTRATARHLGILENTVKTRLLRARRRLRLELANAVGPRKRAEPTMTTYIPRTRRRSLMHW
jgi:RNA polymerase sigma-70 factor (ECF subfamily)